MYLASTVEANTLLERDPLALLIGMLLDQQIPLEKAFTSPDVLRDRLSGALDVRAIAAADPEEFEELFRRPPALHRFPAAMSRRTQALARAIVERYDGDAAAVWTGASDGADLARRLSALPGFGTQKAQIFVALLGKQLGVQPDGWREASGGFGEAGSAKSVADIVDAESLGRVRAYKQQLKAAAKARS